MNQNTAQPLYTRFFDHTILENILKIYLLQGNDYIYQPFALSITSFRTPIYSSFKLVPI